MTSDRLSDITTRSASSAKRRIVALRVGLALFWFLSCLWALDPSVGARMDSSWPVLATCAIMAAETGLLYAFLKPSVAGLASVWWVAAALGVFWALLRFEVGVATDPQGLAYMRLMFVRHIVDVLFLALLVIGIRSLHRALRGRWRRA